MDFQIKRTGRKCHATERDLKPGEQFVSELVVEDGQTLRRDYSSEAWTGPSAESIGWWRCAIPMLDSGRVYWAPRQVLVAFFESMLQDQNKAAVAYVMALLLVRKRILKLVDSSTEDGKQVMELLYSKENQRWMVPEVELDPKQIGKIQQELAEQLFTDRPPGED